MMTREAEAVKDSRRILISRHAAIGDVLLTTPIIREVRRRYPDATIDFETMVPIALENHPCVTKIVPVETDRSEYDLVIDLNLAYEMLPKDHIINSYSLKAFGEIIRDRSVDLNWSIADSRAVDTILQQLDAVFARPVIVHPARSWENRTMPQAFWRGVCCRLTAIGLRVIIVGSESDIDVGRIERLHDFRSKLTIPQIANLISKASCFIGSDSSLLHVAGTTQTPIVGIYTCAKAEYRMPFRRSLLGYRTEAIKPTINCYGCLHDEPVPATFCRCRRGDFVCLLQIDVDVVVDAAIRQLVT